MITRSLETVKTALLSVTDRVYHYHAMKAEAPYIVWAEDGAGDSIRADNMTTMEQVITGTVDLYTADPENPELFRGIQAALNRCCAWRLNSAQHEDDTGLTHFEWVFEVA